jgi:hypothetical protein
MLWIVVGMVALMVLDDVRQMANGRGGCGGRNPKRRTGGEGRKKEGSVTSLVLGSTFPTIAA